MDRLLHPPLIVLTQQPAYETTITFFHISFSSFLEAGPGKSTARQANCFCGWLNDKGRRLDGR